MKINTIIYNWLKTFKSFSTLGSLITCLTLVIIAIFPATFMAQIGPLAVPADIGKLNKIDNNNYKVKLCRGQTFKHYLRQDDLLKDAEIINVVCDLEKIKASRDNVVFKVTEIGSYGVIYEAKKNFRNISVRYELDVKSCISEEEPNIKLCKGDTLKWNLEDWQAVNQKCFKTNMDVVSCQIDRKQVTIVGLGEGRAEMILMTGMNKNSRHKYLPDDEYGDDWIKHKVNVEVKDCGNKKESENEDGSNLPPNYSEDKNYTTGDRQAVKPSIKAVFEKTPIHEGEETRVIVTASDFDSNMQKIIKLTKEGLSFTLESLLATIPFHGSDTTFLLKARGVQPGTDTIFVYVYKDDPNNTQVGNKKDCEIDEKLLADLKEKAKKLWQAFADVVNSIPEDLRNHTKVNELIHKASLNQLSSQEMEFLNVSGKAYFELDYKMRAYADAYASLEREAILKIAQATGNADKLIELKTSISNLEKKLEKQSKVATIKEEEFKKAHKEIYHTYKSNIDLWNKAMSPEGEIGKPLGVVQGAQHSNFMIGPLVYLAAHLAKLKNYETYEKEYDKLIKKKLEGYPEISKTFKKLIDTKNKELRAYEEAKKKECIREWLTESGIQDYHPKLFAPLKTRNTAVEGLLLILKLKMPVNQLKERLLHWFRASQSIGQ